MVPNLKSSGLLFLARGSALWYNPLRKTRGGGAVDALRDMPNVGKVLEKNLIDVGIDTPEALRASGAREAFLRIRAQADPGACLHMLYGLEGAVRGIPDKLLDADTRSALKEFFAKL
jgi:DNA transformation protein